MLWRDALIAVFEGYVCLSFFCRISNRKWHIVYFIPGLLVYAVGMCVMHGLDAKPLSYMFACIFSVFGFSLYYKADVKQKVLYTCLLCIINIGVEIACGYSLILLYQQPISGITAQQGLYIIGAVSSKLVYLVAARIICRFTRGTEATPPHSQWSAVMAIPIVSIFALHGLALTAAECMTTNSVAAFLLLGGIIAVNSIAFIIYDILSGQSKQLVEHEKEKSRYSLETQRYEAIVEQGRELSAAMHETHKHFNVLATLANRKQIDHMSVYINQLTAELDEVINDQEISGYTFIDTILWHKISEAKRNEISVEHSIHIPAGLIIDPVDICVILGNALDNAIEACLKLESDRKINITMKFSKNRLLTVISNTSVPVEIAGDLLTTKVDKAAHGYGMINIKRSLKKYWGNMIPSYNNGIFTLRMLMTF